MADTLLCLDIHKDAVAAVLIDRSAKKNLVIGCGAVEIAEQNFGAAIDRIKEQTGFVAGDSVVTFGAELFSFRNLTLPFTDRKKIEIALRESDRFNRLLFQSSTIGLALARMDGTLVQVNSTYAAIIGHSIPETLELTYWDITPAKYSDQVHSCSTSRDRARSSAS